MLLGQSFQNKMSQVILFQLPPVPYGFLKATSVCGSSLSHTLFHLFIFTSQYSFPYYGVPIHIPGSLAWERSCLCSLYWWTAWAKVSKVNHSKAMTIGDFRVAFRLRFKTSPSAKPFIWKWTKICVWIKLIFIWKLRTRTRFQTEAKCNSEIAYCPLYWLKSNQSTENKQNVHAQSRAPLTQTWLGIWVWYCTMSRKRNDKIDANIDIPVVFKFTWHYIVTFVFIFDGIISFAMTFNLHN